MSDWIHGLPVGLLAVLVFGATYAVAALVHTIVLSLAQGDRLRDFKGVTPGLLPPLGIIFGLVQAVTTVFAIALVHSDNRATARIALGLFSTSIAMCILLLLSHDRPFTGQLSVKPAVLLQVQPQSTSP